MHRSTCITIGGTRCKERLLLCTCMTLWTLQIQEHVVPHGLDLLLQGLKLSATFFTYPSVDGTTATRYRHSHSTILCFPVARGNTSSSVPPPPGTHIFSTLWTNVRHTWIYCCPGIQWVPSFDFDFQPTPVLPCATTMSP
jgi:hypothetical protein